MKSYSEESREGVLAAQVLSTIVCKILCVEGYYTSGVLAGLSIKRKGQTWLHQDAGTCFNLAVERGLSISINENDSVAHINGEVKSRVSFTQTDGNKQTASNIAILESLLVLESKENINAGDQS